MPSTMNVRQYIIFICIAGMFDKPVNPSIQIYGLCLSKSDIYHVKQSYLWAVVQLDIIGCCSEMTIAPTPLCLNKKSAKT